MILLTEILNQSLRSLNRYIGFRLLLVIFIFSPLMLAATFATHPVIYSEALPADSSTVPNSTDSYSPTIIFPSTSHVVKLTSPDGNLYFGRDVAIDGDLAVVNPGSYIFARNQDGEDQWGQVTNLATDSTGGKVAIDGNIVVIGTAVFERNHGGKNNWGLVARLDPNGPTTFQFGNDIAIDGDNIVVADWFMGGKLGTAYVFNRNQGGVKNWGLVTTLIAEDRNYEEDEARFGASVDISGDTIVVGASTTDIGDNGGQGAAYVYTRNQGLWQQAAKLIDTEGNASDGFGSQVAIYGDTVLVKGEGYSWAGSTSNKGAVYIFERDQGGVNNWGLVEKLVEQIGTCGFSFGKSIDLNNDIILIGNPSYSSDCREEARGIAYIYARDPNQGGAWNRAVTLTAEDGAGGDIFGSTLALDDKHMIIGANFADINGVEDQGSAYIYNSLTDTDNDGFLETMDCDDDNPHVTSGNTCVTDSEVMVKSNSEDVTIAFSEVTSGGATTIEVNECASPIDGITLTSSTPLCADITTTATFNGKAKVCMNYDDAGMTEAEESFLRMIHAHGTNEPEFLTCSPFEPPDIVNNIVCGCTDRFSVFAVGTPHDSDQDSVPDLLDNCPTSFNPFQEDLDQDGVGDICTEKDGSSRKIFLPSIMR